MPAATYTLYRENRNDPDLVERAPAVAIPISWLGPPSFRHSCVDSRKVELGLRKTVRAWRNDMTEPRFCKAAAPPWPSCLRD
jgi:hypothetical protein